MLEALLALFEATRDQRFLEEAKTIARLFETKFVSKDWKALLEYFDDAWAPAPDREGYITEPGHQFEWAWLIDRVHRLSGYDARDTARAIQAHGELYGVVPETGYVYDEVWAEGLPKAKTARFWPSTERLKANVVRYELTRDPNAAQAAACESIVSAVNISAGLTCDATDTCPCAGSTEWTPGYYPDGTFTHCAFTPDGPPWLLSYFGLSFAQDSLSNGEGPLMALFEAGSGVCQDIDTFADLTTMTQYESCFAHLLSLDTEGACDPCEAQSCGLDTLCQSDSDDFLQCG